MNDQSQHLNHKGIRTSCMNSETETVSFLSKSEKDTLVYTTPEYFIHHIGKFKRMVDDICLFAVDEAHCASQWGHEFRKSYQELQIIKKEFPDIPLLAVTATATPKVLDDMYSFFGVDEAVEYNLGTKRPNLHISIHEKSESMLRDLKTDNDTSTIIYVQTRKLCDEICVIEPSQNAMCEISWWDETG